MVSGLCGVASYRLRFFFDWCSESPFWAKDDLAREKHDVGPIPPEELGLSHKLPGSDR